MLEKLKTWIKKVTEVTPLDPSLFNDPLAETIEWIPLKKGGTNFHTHRVAAVDHHRMEFLPTPGSCRSSWTNRSGMHLKKTEIIFGAIAVKNYFNSC